MRLLKEKKEEEEKKRGGRLPDCLPAYGNKELYRSAKRLIGNTGFFII